MGLLDLPARKSTSLTPAQAVATSNVSSLSGLGTYDGYTLLAGDPILLTAQSTASQNGLWLAASGSWTRPTEFAAGMTIGPRTCAIVNGTTYAGTIWELRTTNAGIVIGTGSQTWTNISGSGGGVSDAGDLGGSNSSPTVIATHLSSPLPLAQGGTGQSSAQTAMDALAGGTTSANYLRGNGTHVVLSTIQGGDIPYGTTSNTATQGNDSRFTTITANTQTGTTYTLVIGDAGLVVEMNNASANTLTVPPNSSVAFPTGTVLEVCQIGAGQTTIAAGSGVTIDTPSSLTIRAQNSSVRLRKRATNEWVISGDLT